MPVVNQWLVPPTITDSSGRSTTAPGPCWVTTWLGRSLPTFGLRGLSTSVIASSGHREFGVEQVHVDLALHLAQRSRCLEDTLLDPVLLGVEEVALGGAGLLRLRTEAAAGVAELVGLSDIAPPIEVCQDLFPGLRRHLSATGDGPGALRDQFDRFLDPRIRRVELCSVLFAGECGVPEPDQRGEDALETLVAGPG